MQNVTMLGITLQDRSLEESLGNAVRFLRNSALSVIAYIDHPVIRQAVTDPDVRAFIGRAAITEWSDSYLPEALGIHSDERAAQIDERRFLIEELEAMKTGGRSVALAGESMEAIERLESQLSELVPDLNIVLRQVLTPTEGVIPEDEINSINRLAPAMIISHMNYSSLAKWLGYASSMINVGIWLALPDTMSPRVRDFGIAARISHFIGGRLLKLRLNRYKEV